MTQRKLSKKYKKLLSEYKEKKTVTSKINITLKAV